MAVHRPVSGPAQYGATAPTLRCTKGDGKPAVSRRMPGAGLSLWRPGRPRLIGQPSSRTGENPPYGMRGGIEETSASFEARSAPRSYPTDDIVAVEGRVADQRVKGEPVDERRHADRVEPLSWQEHKTYEVAQRVGERQDFGGQAAFGAANSLALRPPFAPCPCRWTLTMVASTRTYSRSGSSETASNSRCQTSAFTQSRKRVKTLFQFPNKGGRSRQGLPVRTIHSTASTNRRLSLPLRPGSPGLPKQRGSIFAHWASVSTKRSIRVVKHSPARMKSVNPNRP